MNQTATRDDFLKPAERRFRWVDVPGWKRVRIQSFNEREASEYQASMLRGDGAVDGRRLRDARLKLIILAVVNKDGRRLLSDHDMPALREMDAGVADYLTDAIREHCGIERGDTEKNFGGSPEITGDDSPSSSPIASAC